MPTMTLKPTNGTEALTSPGAEQVHVELFTEALSVTTNTRKRKERTTSTKAKKRKVVPKITASIRVMRFENKVEELKAYKAEHGHFNVKFKENKSLYEFCLTIQTPDKSNRKLTADRIAQLDAIGFDWDKNMPPGETVAPLPLATNDGVSSIAERALQRLVSLGKVSAEDAEEAIEFAKLEAKWGPSTASAAAALGKTTVLALTE
jgi:hypothetical protein